MSDQIDSSLLKQRLAVARESLERITADRDCVERVLVGLSSIASDLDESRLRAGLAAAAREVAGARFALFVPGGLEDGPTESTLLWGVRPEDFEVALHPRSLPSLPDRLESATATVRVADALASGEVTSFPPQCAVVRYEGPVRSWLGAEIRGASSPRHGVLFLGDPRPHKFSPRHERLIGQMCEHFGKVLDDARRHAERERTLAALERMLLPAFLPHIPGADVAALHRATGSGSVVGGDFYDVFALSDDEWALLLGDVSGTGPDAAALTGIARYTVRALAADAGMPSKVLEELNQALLRGRIADRFCTAVYAQVRPNCNGLELSIAGGGHPSPLVLRADCTVAAGMRQTGVILGVFESVDPQHDVIHLAPGEVLLAYTDGVVEARNSAGELFGEERLSSLLRTCAGRSADGIVRRIELAVLDHLGTRSGDDLALLAVRALPAEGPAAGVG